MNYRFSDYVKNILSEKQWLIEEDKLEENRLLSRESIFSLSNGYMGVRGSFEEGCRVSLPTTFINGIFDKSETFMRELVNLPSGISIRFNIEKQRLTIDDQKVLYHKRVLDLKKAVLVRCVYLKDKDDRITRLEFIRFLSRASIHCGLDRIIITPVNHSSILEMENMIDGSVVNFADALRFKVKHFKVTRNESLTRKDGLYLECKTRDDGLSVGCATRIINEDLNNRQFNCFGEISSEFKDLKITKGKTYVLDKYFVYYTQKDIAKNKLKKACLEELDKLNKRGFDKEFERHIKVYENKWKQADISIVNDDELNKAIRFNVFHLMSTGNEFDNRVNIGSKLLSGEEYGGHAFWDTEMFMLPFFTYEFPDVARNLEEYRYGLLNAARLNAKKTGYNGARYPWESADEGSEQCPDWTIYPDGHAEPCFVAKYEQHVTSAVAYGVVNYVSTTNNLEYLKNQGMEILVETARFWASRLEYNRKFDRYEINDVTGPDEWHEPVNNNLYTNYLARYNLKLVLDLLENYRKNDRSIYNRLCKKIHLERREYIAWKEYIEKIYLPKDENSKLLEQFEGYFKLKDVVIEEYDENDWPVKPKALIGIDRETTQIIKQADVVMLMFILQEEFDLETTVENYHYYEARTLHGSSLSPSIYAIMGLRVNDDSKAYRYLSRAANLDLKDLQGNGREGLHGANMGGVWQTVIFGFGGVSNIDGTLHINPKLPDKWKELKFRINFQNRCLEITINKKINVRRIKGKKINIFVKGRKRSI